jgi:predicted nucleic acid-binding protein
MVSNVYRNAVLIDTSAAVAVVDESDAFHDLARTSLEIIKATDVLFAVDVTAHESFTRLRYNRDLSRARAGYAFLREASVQLLRFEAADESRALSLTQKYQDKALSFHDALCAAVMLNHGLYRIFSFDADFWSFGFEITPGLTRKPTP